MRGRRGDDANWSVASSSGANGERLFDNVNTHNSRVVTFALNVKDLVRAWESSHVSHFATPSSLKDAPRVRARAVLT